MSAESRRVTTSHCSTGPRKQTGIAVELLSTLRIKQQKHAKSSGAAGAIHSFPLLHLFAFRLIQVDYDVRARRHLVHASEIWVHEHDTRKDVWTVTYA